MGKRITPATSSNHKVVCELLDADKAAADRRYRVEWSIDCRLLTGTFYSAGGAGYRPTYDQAMATLQQIS
ncbi:MAG TPA: hypothetical protein VGD29_17905 [Actinoplanes sp.]